MQTTMQITSLDNKLIKHAASLKSKKYRDISGEFLAEGLRNVIDLIKHDCLSVKSIFVTEKQRDKFFAAAFAAGALDQFLNKIVFVVSESIMKKLCDTDASQEIVAVASQKKEIELKGIGEGAGCGLGCGASEDDCVNYIYLDRIRDPGNLGTIMRTAAAAGYRVILADCADVYSPKVVRAGMGAALLTDFIRAGEDALLKLKEKGYLILAADMYGKSMYQFDYVKKICVVIGSEADGVSSSVLEKCDGKISIPIQQVESLNAAVAAGILMYHFR